MKLILVDADDEDTDDDDLEELDELDALAALDIEELDDADEADDADNLDELEEVLDALVTLDMEEPDETLTAEESDELDDKDPTSEELALEVVTADALELLLCEFDMELLLPAPVIDAGTAASFPPVQPDNDIRAKNARTVAIPRTQISFRLSTTLLRMIILQHATLAC